MRSGAFRILQIGAIAVVLAASTLTPFDLDRFSVPKELVLHATVFVAALFAFGALRRVALTRADWLLLIFLGLSGLSAITATNRWLGFRAFALSASAVLLFWIARSLDRPLAGTLAVAVVIACATSLAEAYGVRTIFFASTRVPGGTLGNRNFVAHVAAFGLPIVYFVAIHAERAMRFLMASVGAAIASAALALTRSRGAWIAAVVMFAVFAVFSVRAAFRRPAEAGPHTVWRLAGVLAFSIAGAAAALLLPNALHWRSDNPYLESVSGIANYEQGSGRGRLLQYERSLVMAANHPLLGVGPGNWPVVYPHFAGRNDPSMTSGNMTFNPWPSSDWIAFVSERGLLAAIALFLALISIAFASRDAAVMAIVAATVVAGLFDAVLLLPVPAFIVFASLGTFTRRGEKRHSERSRGIGVGGRAAPPGHTDPSTALGMTPSTALGMTSWAAVVLLMLIAAAGVYRSGAQLLAMNLYDRPSIAASIDPGSYAIQRRVHARAAHALFPYAR